MNALLYIITAICVTLVRRFHRVKLANEGGSASPDTAATALDGSRTRRPLGFATASIRRLIHMAQRVQRGALADVACGR